MTMPNEDRDYHNQGCRNVVALALVAIVVGVGLLVVGGHHILTGAGVGPRCQDGTHATTTHRGACSGHGGYER